MCNVSHAVFYWENEMEMYFDTRERKSAQWLCIKCMERAQQEQANEMNNIEYSMSCGNLVFVCMGLWSVVAVIGRKIGSKKWLFSEYIFISVFFLVPLFVRLVCYYYWFWFAVSRLWMTYLNIHDAIYRIEPSQMKMSLAFFPHDKSHLRLYHTAR